MALPSAGTSTCSAQVLGASRSVGSPTTGAISRCERCGDERLFASLGSSDGRLFASEGSSDAG
eukprot:312576-Prymnesium_polylepis.1